MSAFPGFRIDTLLHESASVRVFRAIADATGQPVILKVVAGQSGARLAHELAVLQRLPASCAVRAHDLLAFDNSHVLVLEDFGGVSLDRLDLAGRLAIGPWLELALRITACLEQLHDQGISHRDLNPSNIVWNRASGVLKFIDLALAATDTPDQAGLARPAPAALEGTPAYLSPEQTGRILRAVDYRSDFYSLGISFFELLCGQLPFPAGDTPALVHAHLARPAPAVDTLRADVPRALAAVIARMLNKLPEERYQSARGLRHDLQQCLLRLGTGADDAGFVPGARDIPDHLLPPRRMYGKRAPLAALRASYARVAAGTAEVVLLRGPAGIGKSRLAQAFCQQLAGTPARCVEGRFEQFKCEVPYSAIVDAFTGLVHLVLAEDEALLRQVRQDLARALGRNGQVLLDMIPDAALLIGPQPALAALPVAQALSRFHHELLGFVSTFAREGRPLVLFVDDLQWADPASLQLLAQLLTEPSGLHLLLLAACRDDDAGNAALLPLTTRLEEAGVACTTLALGPMTRDDTGELLADALDMELPLVQGLAELCWNKTHGNPLFLQQFLKLLAERRILRADTHAGRWQWDMQLADTIEFTDNVVELMLGRLAALPAPSRAVLCVAACIGRVFTLATLAHLCDMSERVVGDRLWAALSDQLIATERGTAAPPAFRFLDDRVQQGAYLLLPAAEQARLHLACGHLHWQRALAPARQPDLFELLFHLNLGRALIDDPAERAALARLNADAGRRARASAAFVPALRHFQMARALCGDADWQADYPFALELALSLAETAYLNNDFAAMEHALQDVLAHARSVIDRARAHDIRIQSYIADDRFKQAVLAGLDVLALLGVHFPRRPRPWHRLASRLRVRWALAWRGSDQLRRAPVMREPAMQVASDILVKMMTASLYALPGYFPLFAECAVALGLRHGNAASAPLNYAIYGMIAGGHQGDIARGARLGELALQLLDRDAAGTHACRTAYLVHAQLWPWVRPLRESLEPIRRDHQCALELGDMEFAANAAFAQAQLSFHAGLPLAGLNAASADNGRAITHLRRPSLLMSQRLLHQTIQNLMGLAPNPAVLHGAVCTPMQLWDMRLMVEDQNLMFQLFNMKMLVSYLFRDYFEARASADLAAPYADAMVSYYGVAVYHFYDALIDLATLDAVAPGERARRLRRIRAAQRSQRAWAAHAPGNFLHKWQLVEAELAGRNGQALRALQYYELAIAGARRGRFLQEEALALELAGQFHATQDRDGVARAYLRDAQQAWQRWGAHGKAAELASRYPRWLPASEAGDSHERGESGMPGAAGTLDLAAVIKAALALSEDIVLARLLKRMMHILVENAGAQKGVLLLEEDGAWQLGAMLAAGQHEATVWSSDDAAAADGALLPLALIRYVIQTGKSVVLADATQDRLAGGDPYVLAERPRAVLVLPVLRQGRMMGIVYLENKVLPGAFTADRIEVLLVLAAQAAIAIENARLYADMERRVAQRTAELQALARRDALTGVANRKAFDDRLRDELSRACRNGAPLAVLMIDLDHFKQINDRYGHAAGDACLRQVGAALATVPTRESDFVARYGGEEFVVLLPNTDAAGARRVADTVLRAVRGVLLEVDGAMHQVTASVGVATRQVRHPSDGAALMASADRQMYAAKAAGRNRVSAEQAPLPLPSELPTTA